MGGRRERGERKTEENLEKDCFGGNREMWQNMELG